MKWYGMELNGIEWNGVIQRREETKKEQHSTMSVVSGSMVDVTWNGMKFLVQN